MPRSLVPVVLVVIAPMIIAGECRGHGDAFHRADAVDVKISPLPAETSTRGDSEASESDGADFDAVLAPVNEIDVPARKGGRVGSVPAPKAQRVSAGRPLARLRAQLLLRGSYLASVHAGQRVTLVPAAGGKGVKARVTRVDPLDRRNGRFRVTIDLDNRRARLREGTSVRVAFDRAPAGGQ